MILTALHSTQSIVPEEKSLDELSNTLAVAQEIESNPDKATDIALADLESYARWLGSKHAADDAKSGLIDYQYLLFKRIIDILLEQLEMRTLTILMHAEHEILYRQYICDETMLGDPVSEIPRDRFWVSEDAYLWDMEELTQAIKSNGGLMRNPLNHKFFSEDGVRAILQHPLGKCLLAFESVEMPELAI